MAKKKSGGETKGAEKSSSRGRRRRPRRRPRRRDRPRGQGGRAKAAAKKGAEAPVKLTPTQGELLKKIGGSETGYLAEKKAEQRTIDALLERKLIKKGAKDKASGNVNYMISSAGKKHPGFQTGGA